eukprot:SAG31_NODE_26436_length_442_cov_1.052478_1_plen_102_part_01
MFLWLLLVALTVKQSLAACPATQVANSDRASTDSVAASNNGDTTTVVCNTGYVGGGVWLCSGSAFIGLECLPQSCSATEVANSDYSATGSIAGSEGDVVNVS